MSDNEQRFWELVEQQIENANQGIDLGEPTLVGDAMLYAAARFNAYLAAAASSERKEFKEELEQTKTLLMEQFETMLNANLEDYLENYKLYLEQ